MSKIIKLGPNLGLNQFGTHYQEYRMTIARRVGYKKRLVEEIRKKEASVGFFHSLFGWLTLLAAFKYWLEFCGVEEERPKKVMINGRLYNLNEIQVIVRGKTSSLRVRGKKVIRSQVHIAGIIYEVDGKLLLDTDGDYYANMDITPEFLSASEDQ